MKYIDNGNGTVTDTSTGLMWQQEAPYNAMTWEEAMVYCKYLSRSGYLDWRLPTIQELKSLVDNTKCNPTIDTKYFPNTGLSFYWSSTIHDIYTDYVWGVYFDDGHEYDNYKGYGCNVRAVRKII